MTKILLTQLPEVRLRALHKSDAGALYDLLQANRDHLTAHGNYVDQVAASYDVIEAELAGGLQSNLRFGIFLAGKLIGRIDLIPVDPPRYGLGYWLAEHATGKGYATSALKALMTFARSELGASDLYAGVSYGNRQSEALLRRNGFQPVADREGYRRFHRIL